MDTTFQIDNWAPVYFLTDVPMFTEELVLNNFHFQPVLVLMKMGLNGEFYVVTMAYV